MDFFSGKNQQFEQETALFLTTDSILSKLEPARPKAKKLLYFAKTSKGSPLKIYASEESLPDTLCLWAKDRCHNIEEKTVQETSCFCLLLQCWKLLILHFLFIISFWGWSLIVLETSQSQLQFSLDRIEGKLGTELWCNEKL